MSQLRPLLSVVEQYRVDLQTLASLRQELLNLSMLLTSIQDEIGAYDYEELQQRVLLLETRLHSCMNKLGTCWRLARHRTGSSPVVFAGTHGFNTFSQVSLDLSDTRSFAACTVFGNEAQRAHAGCSEWCYTSWIAQLAAQPHLLTITSGLKHQTLLRTTKHTWLLRRGRRQHAQHLDNIGHVLHSLDLPAPFTATAA